MPAILVQGRAALLDRVPGVAQFQVVQTAPATLRVRLRAGDGEIAHLLSEQKAGDITLERADEPPQQGTGGKFRRVIPLAKL